MTAPSEVVNGTGFLALPVGAAATLQVLGECMNPLFESGDLLRVERCVEGATEPGDVVVAKNSAGRFVAHLLLAKNPAQTGGLRGGDDPTPVEVIGRVIAVNDQRRLAFGRALSRTALLSARELFQQLRKRQGLRILRRWIEAVLESGPGARIARRPATRVVVRRLELDDLVPLLVFATRHLAVPPEFLKKQLWTRWYVRGVAVGAFESKSRLCGFVFLDEFSQEGMSLEGWWVRTLFVEPQWRRRRIGHRMVELLIQGAEQQGIDFARADIPAGNRASQHLFASLGFRPAGAEWNERVRREWQRNRVSDEWVVLERRLLATP